MNIRAVLRTYSALRQMSPDDIALLETLRALNDNDRELLVEMMTDKPTGKKASKKPSTKSSLSKSPRATGIEQQLSKRREQGRAGTTSADDDDFPDLLGGHEPCAFQYEAGVVCEAASDANVHHLQTDSLYHPFQPAAPPAPTQSPANGGAGSGTANSGIEKDDASNAVHTGD